MKANRLASTDPGSVVTMAISMIIEATQVSNLTMDKGLATATPKQQKTTEHAKIKQAARQPVLITTGIPGWLQPHKQDRGNLHTEETLHFILNKVSDGQSLASICREYPELPPAGVIRRWIYDDENLKKNYYKAQMIGSEKIVDEIVDIADGTDSKDGIPEDVQRSMLRINTRKWLIEKWHRERYGKADSTQVNLNIDLNEAMLKGLKRAEEMNTVIDGEFGEL